MSTQVRTTTVIAGAFANGKNADGSQQKGNFTAETATGLQFFIKKEKMHALGIKTDADFAKQKTLYVILKDRLISGGKDQDNNPLPPSIRTEAGSVFKTEEEMLLASIQDDLQGQKRTIMLRSAYEKSVKSSGLEESSVNLLLGVSSFV